MGMIDREKVIRGLECCLSIYIDGLCDDCPYMGELDKSYMVPMKCKEIIMRDALALLKEQEQTPGVWVSVKDRLPKDGIFVLVCNDDGHMMLAKWESEAVHWEYKYMNYDWDVWDEEEQGPICYWMPLPEPPKEDEDD